MTALRANSWNQSPCSGQPLAPEGGDLHSSPEVGLYRLFTLRGEVDPWNERHAAGRSRTISADRECWSTINLSRPLTS